MNSSSTNMTEAEDKFPVRRKQVQDASSEPAGRSRAISGASKIRGPPVCRTQLWMSFRERVCVARNASTSAAGKFWTTSGTSRGKTNGEPFSGMSQPNGGSGDAAEAKNRDAFDVRIETHSIYQAGVDRWAANAGNRYKEERSDIGGCESGAIQGGAECLFA